MQFQFENNGEYTKEDIGGFIVLEDAIAGKITEVTEELVKFEVFKEFESMFLSMIEPSNFGSYTIN